MATWIDRQRRALKRRGRQGNAPILAVLGIGAGLMYLLDPDRGPRRRALVRDKSVHALHALNELFEKGARDLACRTRGFIAETQAFLRDEDVPDDILKERVRAKLGHVVSHPHAIDVTVRDGQVTLVGPILTEDVDRLLSAVAVVPGVRSLEPHLDIYETPGSIPALQGGDPDQEKRVERSRERWSPILRLLAGITGVGLLGAGLLRRDRLGTLLRVGGAAVLARDVANQPLKRLLGIGAGKNAVEIQKTFTVQAPVEDVFELWINCDTFPLFMANILRVEPLGEGRYRWVARGPAGLPVSWEAEVTELIPNQRIAWASLPGAFVANEGIVQFDETLQGNTRVDIKLAYNPPGGLLGHAVASLFGVDPKHAMDEDLVRFQSLIERGKTTAHGHEVRFAEVTARVEE
jgi:uncharacterized membrane protein